MIKKLVPVLGAVLIAGSALAVSAPSFANTPTASSSESSSSTTTTKKHKHKKTSSTSSSSSG